MPVLGREKGRGEGEMIEVWCVLAIITSILIADCKLVFKVCGVENTPHLICACLTCLNNHGIFVCL